MAQRFLAAWQMPVLKQCHRKSLRSSLGLGNNYSEIKLLLTSEIDALVSISRFWDLSGVCMQSRGGEWYPISPDPRAVIKAKMACEGDKGVGWETEKYTELICLWEFCPRFIETVRQLKERMLQTQGRVSPWNQERQSETIFLMSKCKVQQNAELLLRPVSSANCTYVFL